MFVTKKKDLCLIKLEFNCSKVKMNILHYVSIGMKLHEIFYTVWYSNDILL